MTIACRSFVTLLSLMLALPAAAQSEPSDTSRIIDEGMNRSEVMMLAHELMDGIGPRLTKSPGMSRAEDWAIEKFEGWNLSNVHREAFEFGRGWEAIDSSVKMVEPRPLTLTAIPIAWTPGTDGLVRAEIVVAPMSKKSHFDAYRGKLKGKIVLISLPGEGDEPTTPPFQRFTSDEIRKMDDYSQPTYDPEADDRRRERRTIALDRDAFLAEEGAVLWVRKSYRDGKLLHGSGSTYKLDERSTIPGIELAAEDYRRLARLAKTGPAPVLEVRTEVQFYEDDPNAHNVIAEIPGTDPKAGYVMAGAHFDSWAAADGAVDNGAGSVVVMEAARILKTLGFKPKRTIRFVLWEGEEQGLLGSLAYAERHLVTRPEETDDGPSWRNRYPLEKKKGYGDLKAYFNMDNGSGKFRGIYAEGNYEAVPLLKQWLSPFSNMDASTVVAGPTGGTDHVYLQSVGIPAFQFIQDPLDYRSRLHHTNADTFDHLRPADLRQASVVMAGVLLAAANDEETIPAKPLPKPPSVTDPFKYDYPEEN